MLDGRHEIHRGASPASPLRGLQALPASGAPGISAPGSGRGCAVASRAVVAGSAQRLRRRWPRRARRVLQASAAHTDRPTDAIGYGGPVLAHQLCAEVPTRRRSARASSRSMSSRRRDPRLNRAMGRKPRSRCPPARPRPLLADSRGRRFHPGCTGCAAHTAAVGQPPQDGRRRETMWCDRAEQLRRLGVDGRPILPSRDRSDRQDLPPPTSVPGAAASRENWRPSGESPEDSMHRPRDCPCNTVRSDRFRSLTKVENHEKTPTLLGAARPA